jgi:hypothetical protein
MTQPGQKLWARHLNPEGESDTGLVHNSGADVWILGMKCEGRGVRIRTENQGRTEVYGAFIYGPGIAAEDKRPLFEVDSGQFSIAGMREIAFDVPTYNVKVRETRKGETRTLTSATEGGWIGWTLFSAWQPPQSP